MCCCTILTTDTARVLENLMKNLFAIFHGFLKLAHQSINFLLFIMQTITVARLRLRFQAIKDLFEIPFIHFYLQGWIPPSKNSMLGSAIPAIGIVFLLSTYLYLLLSKKFTHKQNAGDHPAGRKPCLCKFNVQGTIDLETRTKTTILCSTSISRFLLPYYVIYKQD